MIELIGMIAAWSAAYLGYSKTREFVRSRLRYVDGVHRASAPVKAGAAATLVALPVVAVLPAVGFPSAMLLGVAVGMGVSAGSRDIRRQLPGF